MIFSLFNFIYIISVCYQPNLTDSSFHQLTSNMRLSHGDTTQNGHAMLLKEH